MKYNFCTLFDRNYLFKGVALYNSLLKHCDDFVLYVLCLDEICFKMLRDFNLTKVRLIKLEDLENEELLRIKQTRSKLEYYWTLTPYLLLYILNNYNVSEITYLDADLYFFSSPRKIFKEIKDANIAIIEHRYPKYRDRSKKSGRFCVEWITFRNTAESLTCLNWWKDRCKEWCYAREEEGKFGDQKYLDDWDRRFRGVHIIKSLGAGLAPWNLMQYKYSLNQDNQLVINSEPLIFFHFHNLGIVDRNTFDINRGYEIFKIIKEQVYAPYINELKNVINMVLEKDKNWSYDFSERLSLRAKIYFFLLMMKYKIKRYAHSLF